ncbi:MAG: DUF2145 domain-containing protein, partial [Comamonas sp.]
MAQRAARRAATALLAAAAILAALLAAVPAQAGTSTSGFCDKPSHIDASRQDRLLRFAAVVKQELARAGHGAALISRTGTDLARFGIRYSHAGIALADNPAGPWAVRQLYYACDESRARLFDQGISGFMLGADDPSHGYVSLLLLPEAQGQTLAAAALDKRQALALLSADYSANAYAWSTRYQNCNQWVMEMIADAWGNADGAPQPREAAQQWLRAQGYQPETIDVGARWLVIAAHFTPLVHVRDHPIEDLRALQMQVSMPASIEQFVRQQVPQSRRIELCYDTRHIVVRRDGPPLAESCQPEA